MTLHPHITLHELTEYCKLCHEHGCKKVRVEKPIAQRIRQITLYPSRQPKHLGITFIHRHRT